MENENDTKEFQSPQIVSVENLSCEISAYQTDDDEYPMF